MSSLYDDYRNTDYLDDLSFIAGTEMTLKFPIQNEYGTLININGATMKWALALYGQPDQTVLEKDATIYDANTFVVELTEADTLALGGAIYLQQMRITDSAGKKIRPAQGIVIIRKAVSMS